MSVRGPRRISVIALAACEILGAFLLVMSVRKLCYALHRPVVSYDEGILLTDSMLVSMGQVPYRDFYTNYGPGIFVAIATIWKVVGVSAFAPRVLGCLLQVSIAVLCGGLTGRMTGRRFSLLAAGLVAAWLSPLDPPLPYAWFPALAMSLACVWALSTAVDGGGTRAWVAAGGLLGMTSWFRPELAVSLALALAAIGVATFAAGMSPWSAERRRGAGFLVLAAAATALPVWALMFALSGALPLQDLLIEQTRIRAARVLPFPPLLSLTVTEDLPYRLPALLADSYAAGVVLDLAAPAVGVLLAAFGARVGVARRSVPLLLAALAAAVLPQMLGRSDAVHCLFTVAPALALFAALCTLLAAATPARALLATAGAAALFLPCRDLHPPEPGPSGSTRGFARYGGIPDRDPYRLKVLEILREQTVPNEPIFVGLLDHRRTLSNDVLLYFLAERPAGTRYLQFDPNLTNREDIQARMIQDLETRRVRWAVVSLQSVGDDEPNESSRLGSDALDLFLRRSFRVFAQTGPYLVLRRMGD
jgi:hypothetical protein